MAHLLGYSGGTTGLTVGIFTAAAYALGSGYMDRAARPFLTSADLGTGNGALAQRCRPALRYCRGGTLGLSYAMTADRNMLRWTEVNMDAPGDFYCRRTATRCQDWRYVFSNWFSASNVILSWSYLRIIM